FCLLRCSCHWILRSIGARKVEDNLRMRWLPAIEQALKIFRNAHPQMRIDTDNASRHPEPDQLDARDSDRPVEPHLRGSDLPDRKTSAVQMQADTRNADHERRVFPDRDAIA